MYRSQKVCPNKCLSERPAATVKLTYLDTLIDSYTTNTFSFLIKIWHYIRRREEDVNRREYISLLL